MAYSFHFLLIFAFAGSNAFSQGNHSTGTSSQETEQRTSPIIVTHVPPANDVTRVGVEQTHAYEAQDGQVRLQLESPRIHCPRSADEDEMALRACLARDPNPVGNIVLDAGHSDHTDNNRDRYRESSDRSEDQDELHEGHINMATAILTQKILQQCYSMPASKIHLTRYPGELEFGEFHNTQYALDAQRRYEVSVRSDITSTLGNDVLPRKRFINYLLTENSTPAAHSVMVSVHANAGGADYVAMFHPRQGENSQRLARNLLNHVVENTQPRYSEAIEALRERQTELERAGVERHNEEMKKIAEDIRKLERARGIYRRGPRTNQFTSRTIEGDENGRGGGRDADFAIYRDLPRGAAGVLTEGFFMDGILGQNANQEIADIRNRMSQVQSEISGASNDEARKAELQQSYDRIKQDNFMTLHKSQYNSKTQTWERSTDSAIEYPVATILKNYAQGLATGLSRYMLDKCTLAEAES